MGGYVADIIGSQLGVDVLLFNPALHNRTTIREFNEDYGYVNKISNFKWKNGIFELIKFLNDNNYFVFVISNQSGIGRGYYSQKSVDTLHNWVQKRINKKGSHIDKFYIAIE